MLKFIRHISKHLNIAWIFHFSSPTRNWSWIYSAAKKNSLYYLEIDRMLPVNISSNPVLTSNFALQDVTFIVVPSPGALSHMYRACIRLDVLWQLPCSRMLWKGRFVLLTAAMSIVKTEALLYVWSCACSFQTGRHMTPLRFLPAYDYHVAPRLDVGRSI